MRRERPHVRRATALVAASAALATGALAGVSPTQAAGGPGPRAVGDLVVYPVPTTGAGLGRISTAPNGDLWFVESEVNQVGRITPAGVITEFELPDVLSPDVARVTDLEVAADGRVWVIYDSGNVVIGLNPNGTVSEGPYSLGGYPYGEEIRADATGKVWISNSYDVDFLSWIVFGDDVWTDDNAPPCDGALGAGTDGQMWCAFDRKIIRADADGAGGVTFPVPELPSVAYSTPYSLAPGPVGAIWFGRDNGGTIFTPRRGGSIGYLTHAGQVHLFNTGDRSAPHSLVEGPDGAMWFTNWGADPAIGHYDPVTGRGSLSAVGAYSPDWMTFDQAGMIWATDGSNNSILRIDPDALRVTDVDPGPGSVLIDFPVGRPVVPTAPAKVKNNKVKVKIACPTSAGAGCHGTVILRSTHRGHPAVTKRMAFSVDAGTTSAGTLKVTTAGARLLPKGKNVKVRQELAPTWDNKAAAVAVIRIRR